MKKITIIYWSSTGNTETMAKGIYDGIKSKNEVETVEVKLMHVSEASKEDIKTSDLVAFGCSAMGVEEIDSSEMEPFINGITAELHNKNISLFGSYDWGDGQWLEDWQNEMLDYGVNVITDNLMLQTSPDEDGLKECYHYGHKLLEYIIN